jgi:hypothetical protein
MKRKSYNRNRNRNRYKNSNYLLFSSIFREILKTTHSKYNNIIAKQLLSDENDKPFDINFSWINSTKGDDVVSYASVSSVKSHGDEWKKENRKTFLLKVFIKKVYGKTFSNKQIKDFTSKYKIVHNDLSKKRPKKKYDDDTILNNIIEYTKNGDIIWKKKTDNEEYEKFTSIYNINKYKKLVFDLYYKPHLNESFFSIKMSMTYDNGKSKKYIFIKSIVDDSYLLRDATNLIKNKVEYNVQ